DSALQSVGKRLIALELDAQIFHPAGPIRLILHGTGILVLRRRFPILVLGLILAVLTVVLTIGHRSLGWILGGFCRTHFRRIRRSRRRRHVRQVLVGIHLSGLLEFFAPGLLLPRNVPER